MALDLKVGQHESWMEHGFFYIRAQPKKSGRDVPVGLNTAKIMGLWKENSKMSHLIWSQSKRRCFILCYVSSKKPFLLSMCFSGEVNF